MLLGAPTEEVGQSQSAQTRYTVISVHPSHPCIPVTILPWDNPLSSSCSKRALSTVNVVINSWKRRRRLNLVALASKTPSSQKDSA